MAGHVDVARELAELRRNSRERGPYRLVVSLVLGICRSTVEPHLASEHSVNERSGAVNAEPVIAIEKPTVVASVAVICPSVVRDRLLRLLGTIRHAPLIEALELDL